MKKFALLIIFLSMLVLSFGGCSSKGDTTTGKNGKAERPPVAVETLTAATSEITEGVDVVGTLTPKFETEVKSQILGLVREVYVTEWVRVKKNTPLARIDVSETEALTRKAEARAAEEELRHMQARLSKGLIRSPMEGVVSLRDVNVGDLASDTGSAKPLFKIVDNRILNLTVTVPSVEMAGLKVGHTLTFTVGSLPRKTFSGRVMYINPVVDEADRSVKVIAEVENRSGELKGGLFAKGRILTGAKRNVLQVPRSALIGVNITEKKAGLFVVPEDRARFREVTTGVISGEHVEIASGLDPGERVVVRGSFNLRDSDRVITP